MFILNKHWARIFKVWPEFLDYGTGLGDRGTMLHFAACSITRSGCVEEGPAQASKQLGE